MVTDEQLNEIVGRATPTDRLCAWETMKTHERRGKLKEAIIELLQNNVTLTKQICNEDTGNVGSETD